MTGGRGFKAVKPYFKAVKPYVKTVKLYVPKLVSDFNQEGFTIVILMKLGIQIMSITVQHKSTQYLNGTVGIGYRTSANRFPYGYCYSDFAEDGSRRSCFFHVCLCWVVVRLVGSLYFNRRCLYGHVKQKLEQCIQYSIELKLYG